MKHSELLLICLAAIFVISTFSFIYEIQKIGTEVREIRNQMGVLGSTVTETASSDTLNTFRTNVNSSLTSLQNDKVSTTTAYTWTQLQKFFGHASSTAFSANFAQVGGSATTTLNANGRVGIASSSPFLNLGIGNTSTSTIGGNFFCAYFKDEAGRGMWIKLAISGSHVFSTSTTACN